MQDSKYLVDSSEDEKEDIPPLLDALASQENYIKYISNIIKQKYRQLLEKRSICPHTALSIACGLALHNYADRILSNGVVRESVNVKKLELLGLDKDQMDDSVQKVKTVLSSNVSNPDYPLNLTADQVKRLNSKDIEQLFFSSFNREVPMPAGILH